MGYNYTHVDDGKGSIGVLKGTPQYYQKMGSKRVIKGVQA